MSAHDPQPGVRVQLVQGGRWSRKKKLFVFGCGSFVLLGLLSCVFSILLVRGTFDAPFVEGERFASTAENVVVLRADLEDPGVAEVLPILLAEVMKQPDDPNLPGPVRWLNDQNAKQNAGNVGMYLPVTVTALWDEAPVGSAATAGVWSGSNYILPPQPRKAVVVQYRGFTALAARFFGFVAAKEAGPEAYVHRGRSFHASRRHELDSDARELIHLGKRFIYANRESLARDLVEVEASPEGPARPASDPVALLALLPPGRDAAGLHRGPAAPRAVKELLDIWAGMGAVRAGKKLEEKGAPFPIDFDAGRLEVVAWSIDAEGQDRARIDLVLRFDGEDPASAAERALGPEGEAWAALADLRVPLDSREVKRIDPRTVHATARGTGVRAALESAARDWQAYTKAEREASSRAIEKALGDAKAAARKANADKKKPAKSKPASEKVPDEDEGD